jgi:hypothetical protein
MPGLVPCPSASLEALPVDMTSADLDEVAEDEFDEDDEDEDDERAGQSRRWVRYVMPVMVEVDCDTDEITSVLTLPGEVRLDRDDTMDICIYDEKFRRKSLREQPKAQALYVSEPEWQDPGLRSGRPANWPGQNRNRANWSRPAGGARARRSSAAPLALLSSTRCFLHARAWARDGGLRAQRAARL